MQAREPETGNTQKDANAGPPVPGQTTKIALAPIFRDQIDRQKHRQQGDDDQKLRLSHLLAHIHP